MLLTLSIRNVVLIEEMEISFSEGLCVFTGETGAGKTILLDALSLATGSRSDTSLIRAGADKLSVTAEFSISSNSKVKQDLEEHAIETKDNTIVIRRIINTDGKSKAYINDEQVSIGFLKTIGEQLLEVHGQFATHGLLDQTNHIKHLDSYGNLSSCSEYYDAWKKASFELEKAEQTLLKAKEEEDYLRYNYEELKKLSPSVGEEEELSEKHSLLINWEKTSEYLKQSYEALTMSGGTASSLRTALKNISKLASDTTDKNLCGIKEALERAEIEISEATNQIEKLKDNTYFDSKTLEDIDNRLFALRDLARKHRTTVDNLPQVLSDFEQKLSLINDGSKGLDELKQAKEKAKEVFIKKANALSEARKKVANKLDKSVMTELPALKLEKAKFRTEIQDLEETEWNENGTNKVFFSISTNIGSPFNALNKIASGGELARFMLALKLNLAATDSTATLIFDEIDAGMGGATAAAIGSRLAKLAKDCQVIVVTHSAQIASFANQHIYISKQKKEGEETTITTAFTLNENQKSEEIARMLSGSTITDEARAAAKKLLESK